MAEVQVEREPGSGGGLGLRPPGRRPRVLEPVDDSGRFKQPLRLSTLQPVQDTRVVFSLNKRTVGSLRGSLGY